MTVAETRQPEREPEPEKKPEAGDPAAPLPRRSWWHRHLEPEERRRVLEDLAITRVPRWGYRFTIMLTLSVVVAIMGLSLDSAAVVIGAMLLAPLMQPVLACGACLSMALFTKSMVALAKVAAATAWSIAIAFAISWILPDQELTDEVLARVAPDLRDMIVALAAGAAGAYATVRARASASLPGVAVAVALVPPLGSVGIALEHGETLLARGAFLLYITNLSAIVFASIVVFVVTGFVPPRRLSDNLLRLSLATVLLTAVVIVVAVPLYRTSLDAIEDRDDDRTADEIVEAWLAGDSAPDAVVESDAKVRREDMQVVVELRGPSLGQLREADLEEAMEQEFDGFNVAVQWIRTEEPPTTTTEPPPDPTERLLTRIRAEVDEWLTEGEITYQIDDIRLNGNLVRIDAAGTGDPPPIEDLIPRLETIDLSLSPVLNWETLTTATTATTVSPEELTGSELESVVQRWADTRDLILQQFNYDGRSIEIDVLGAAQPDIARLELDLWEITEDQPPVRVFFTQRNLVTTTVPLTIPLQTR